MSNKTVDYTLRQALSYSKDGVKVEEQVLFLEAPNLGSTKTKKNARKLKNLALSAFGQMQKALTKEQTEEAQKAAAENSEDPKEESGEERGLLGMFALGGIDTQPLCEAMESLAPSVIKIGDTGMALKEVLWDKLDMDDQEELTSVYIASFLGL